MNEIEVILKNGDKILGDVTKGNIHDLEKEVNKKKFITLGNSLINTSEIVRVNFK